MAREIDALKMKLWICLFSMEHAYLFDVLIYEFKLRTC